MATPRVDEREKGEEEAEALEGEAVTQYRSTSARCNYRSQDRPELIYATKECCRESASGGVTMVGSHCARAWSKTQAIVARSSGESELYGVVRATCEALGTQTLFSDVGREVKAKVHVVASTAKSICERNGVDNIRHLDVAHLWLQEQQVRDKAALSKIHGNVNMTDLMTKHLSFKESEGHLEKLNLYFRDGRSEKASQLYGVQYSINDVCAFVNSVHDGSCGLRRGCNDGTGDGGGHGGVGIHTDGDGDCGINSEQTETNQDRWTARACNKMWVREHRRPRISLCSPLGVPRGPANPYQEFLRIRVTEGALLDGRCFNIVDNWNEDTRGQIHGAWTGRTTFYFPQNLQKGTAAVDSF